jgi:mannose-6-phosphate isomerase-like protein (cupin superfamily)
MRASVVGVLLTGLVVTAPMLAAQTRSKPAAAASVTLVVRVTDTTGTPQPAVKIAATGPVNRSGVTDGTGTLRFTGMRPGAYRLRFDGEKVISRATPPSDELEVALTPAPPPPPPPPPPKPEPAPRPPVKTPDPRTVAIPDYVERNAIGAREPAKTSVIACGGTTTTSLIQIREPLEGRLHKDADELLYVVGGEGVLSLSTQDVPLRAGTFSLVPRGMAHAIIRRGRSGLILLSTLTETPCDNAK